MSYKNRILLAVCVSELFIAPLLIVIYLQFVKSFELIAIQKNMGEE
jgi:hypothetical protein